MNTHASPNSQLEAPPDAGPPPAPAAFHFSDARLPGLSVALDLDAIHQALCEMFLVSHDAIQGLRISEVRYKPETSCLLAYEALIQGAQRFAYSRTIRTEHWSAQSARWKLAAANERRPVWQPSNGSLVLLGWPEDRRLRSLRRWAASPDWLLTRWLDEPPDGGHALRTSLLTWRPERRAVFSVSRDGRPVAVAKLHDQPSFERIWSIAKTLRCMGSPLVPELLGRSKRHATMLYRWQPGDPLDDHVATDDAIERQLDLAARTTRQLAQLHPGDLPPWSFGAEVEAAESMARITARLLPEAASLVQNTLTCWRAASAPASPGVFCHGDLHRRQILVDGDRVRLCDFDRATIGPRDLDLANFTAHAILDSVLREQADIKSWANRAAEYRQSSRREFDSLVAARVIALAMTPFRRANPDWRRQMLALWSAALALVTAPPSPGSNHRRMSNGGAAIHRVASTASAPRDADLKKAIQSDRKLNVAPELLDPAALTATLDTSGGELPGIVDRFRIVAIVPRRHKPGRRCLLEVQCEARDNPTETCSMMAKVHWRKRHQNAMEVQRRLVQDAQFDGSHSDRPRVPLPLGHIPNWRVWFQECCPGTMLTQLMDRDCATVLMRAGAGLARIHESGLNAKRRHSWRDEWNILDRHLTAATARFPDSVRRIDVLRRRLSRMLDQVAQNRQHDANHLLHRDFYPDQILVAGDQLTFVDWDLTAMGCALIDVGNFVAHIRERGLRKTGDVERFRALERSFLEGYRQIRPIRNQDVEAMSAISIARHLGIVLRKPRRRHVWPLLLDYVEWCCR